MLFLLLSLVEPTTTTTTQPNTTQSHITMSNSHTTAYLSNLPAELLGASFSLGKEACVDKATGDAFGILIARFVQWDYHHLQQQSIEEWSNTKVTITGTAQPVVPYLTGAEPERPFAAKVLGEDGDHTFDGAEHGSVYHNRTFESAYQRNTPYVMSIK